MTPSNRVAETSDHWLGVDSLSSTICVTPVWGVRVPSRQQSTYLYTSWWMTNDGAEESESLDDLFSEIWERESQPELSFPINGIGSVSVCHVPQQFGPALSHHRCCDTPPAATGIVENTPGLSNIDWYWLVRLFQ